MITRKDVEIQLETGLIPPGRLKSLQYGLSRRRDAARTKAKRKGLDERFVASLQGKAAGYQEAIDLIDAVLAGRGMRSSRWAPSDKRKPPG